MHWWPSKDDKDFSRSTWADRATDLAKSATQVCRLDIMVPTCAGVAMLRYAAGPLYASSEALQSIYYKGSREEENKLAKLKRWNGDKISLDMVAVYHVKSVSLSFSLSLKCIVFVLQYINYMDCYSMPSPNISPLYPGNSPWQLAHCRSRSPYECNMAEI